MSNIDALNALEQRLRETADRAESVIPHIHGAGHCLACTVARDLRESADALARVAALFS